MKRQPVAVLSPGLLIKRSVVAVIITMLVALCFNYLSPNRIPLITPHREISVGAQQTKIPVFRNYRQIQADRQNTSIHAPQEIDLETAYRNFINYGAIFIDTRSADDYREGHIPRAVSIPLETLDASEALLFDLSRGETLISYCDGEECSQSIDMAVLLSEMGFTDVYFFFGGWEQWLTAGYPIQTGDHP